MRKTLAMNAESAADRARRLWDGSAESTARRLLEELARNEEAVEVLLPWITDRVRAAFRNEVRMIERAAFSDPAGKSPRVARSILTQTGPLPDLTNLEVLLSYPVLVPGKNRNQSVPWRDLTIEDHQARIGLLSKPLKAVQTTISQHQWSIEEIRKYRVNCLGDIEVAVLQRDMKLVP